MDRRTRRPGRGHTPDPPRDRGSSYVEVVISVVLIGTTLIALLGTMMASISSSTRSRSLSQVNTVLQNAADRVNRAPKRCDYTVYVQAAAQSQGWQPTTATATYQHYVPGDAADDAGTWSVGACPTGGATELLVQLVTITVVSPDGEVSRTIQVAKSDV